MLITWGSHVVGAAALMMRVTCVEAGYYWLVGAQPWVVLVVPEWWSDKSL